VRAGEVNPERVEIAKSADKEDKYKNMIKQ